MDENLNLQMVLNLRDKATKKLKVFNRELLKTQKLMKQQSRLELSTPASTGKPSGGSGSDLAGLAAGAGGLSAVSGLSGLGAMAGTFQKQMVQIEASLLHVSTAMATYVESMAKGKTSTQAFQQIQDEDVFDNLADGVDRASTEIDRNTNSQKRNEKASKRTTKALKGQAKTVGGLSNAYRTLKPLIATYLGTQTVSKIIEIGAQYQDLKTTLKIVTGSLEDQARAFQFIKQLALELPLSVAELTEAFIRMKSLGIAPTEARLISFTNTASAMNKTLRQMTEAVADAATFQFERLKEFGIKASKVGKTVEFVFRNEKTVVKASSIEIVKYLEKIGDAHDGVFAGAATEKMKNYNGVLSNTKDKFATLASEIFNGGIGDGLTTIVKLAGEAALWFSNLSREVRLFGVDAVDAVDFFVTGFINGFQQMTVIADVITSNMYTNLVNNLNKFGNVFKRSINALMAGIPGMDLQVFSEFADPKPLKDYSIELKKLIATQLEQREIHDAAIQSWVDEINASEDAKDIANDYNETLKKEAAASELSANARDKAGAALTGYAKFLKEVRDSMKDTISTQDYAKRALLELTTEYNLGTLSLRQYTEALSLLVDETGEALAETDEYAQFLRNVREEVDQSIQVSEFSKQALNELTHEYNAGKLTLEQYTLAMGKLLDGMTDINFDRSKAELSDFTVFMQDAASAMEDSFAGGFFDIMQGKTTDMVASFKSAIDQMVAKALAAELMKALMGSFGETGNVGGLVGSVIDGFRAEGGPVSAGGSYVVGERGPELFTPKSNGSILPNEQLAGGGSAGKTVNVNITAMDSQDVQRSLEQNRRYIAELVNGTNQTYNLV